MENNSQQSAANVGAQFGGYPMLPPYDDLLQQQHQQQLQMFWTHRRQEIEQIDNFKNHQLPLARIKKIMKADEDVRMISAEAPIVFAKACELFIMQLTMRSWHHAEDNKRRILQKEDIAAAINGTDIFDFLVDVVPTDEIKEEATGLGPGMVGSAASGVPYYYPPMIQPDQSGVMMGMPTRSVVAPSVYVPPAQEWRSVWPAAEDNPYATGGNSGQGNLDGQSFPDASWNNGGY